MSRRRHFPKLTFLTLVGLAVFLPLYFVGLAPAGGDSGTVGPVRIEDVRIYRLPDASSPRIEVGIELKNHDQIAHEIQAWWFLAKPDIKRPWTLYAFKSIEGQATLAAGESLELSWEEEVTAEPGTYELSAWVHTVHGDGTRHSDGERVGSPTIRIDPQSSPLSRRSSPPPGLHVSAVDLPAHAPDDGLSQPTELPVTMTVTNYTAAETVADVQWFLYRREARLPWGGTPAYTSRQLLHQVFAPQRPTTITIGEPISLWPGEYQLRVMVRVPEGEDGAVGDDLFLNHAITLLESDREATIIRASLTSGPVEIASLAADTGSFERGKGSVMVGLRNGSESEQEVVLWWFLSRPGSLQPWIEFALQSKVFSEKIAPHQQSILDLSDDVALPPGTYELSVWVHTLDGEGGQHPSDGAWFNRRIEVH